jgi:hypothetical protein
MSAGWDFRTGRLRIPPASPRPTTAAGNARQRPSMSQATSAGLSKGQGRPLAWQASTREIMCADLVPEAPVGVFLRSREPLLRAGVTWTAAPGVNDHSGDRRTPSRSAGALRTFAPSGPALREDLLRVQQRYGTAALSSTWRLARLCPLRRPRHAPTEASRRLGRAAGRANRSQTLSIHLTSDGLTCANAPYGPCAARTFRVQGETSVFAGQDG